MEMRPSTPPKVTMFVWMSSERERERERGMEGEKEKEKEKEKGINFV
jgi:hypothetical protein